MKTIAFLTLLLAGTPAFAAPPVKPSQSKYSHLSSNSPFTTKPVVKMEERIDTTFEDWALGGVSEIDGGYMVTLINKKNQGETKVIRPRGTVHSKKDEMEWINPGAEGSFKVERVTYGKTSWKDTTVLVSAGGKTGTMKFDDKQLTPAATAAPGRHQGGPPGQQPGQPGGPNPAINQPGQPGQQGGPGSQGGRPTRQRVLPPAPNQGQGQNQGQTQGQGSDRGRGRNR